MKTTILDEYLKDEEFQRLFAQEELILEVTERFSEALSQAGITKADLAKRLGKTKGFVSQILAGGRNLTLRTIADVADSLGYRIRIELGKEIRSEETAARTLPRHNGRKVIPLTFAHPQEFKVTRHEQIVYARGPIGHMQGAA